MCLAPPGLPAQVLHRPTDRATTPTEPSRMSNLFPHPLILGHRGSPREATENTLRALSLALERGADGVELDVRRTSDGVPVVIHDATLDRTMPARGRVAALRWAGIERLTGALLPSFEQACAWAAASGAWLNAELKSAGVEEEVLRLLGEMELRERTILSSFDPGVLCRVRDLDPSFRRFLLTEVWDAQAARNLRSTGAGGVCLQVDAASAESLADLASRGLPVVVWTVNDPARIRELLHAEVAGIITDDPAAGARVREELGRG
jgi:glycerophosphoryl diester phosphodiesterase